MANNEGKLGGVAAGQFHCFSIPPSGHAHPVRQLHWGEHTIESGMDVYLYKQTVSLGCIVQVEPASDPGFGALQILWCAYVSLVFYNQVPKMSVAQQMTNLPHD